MMGEHYCSEERSDEQKVASCVAECPSLLVRSHLIPQGRGPDVRQSVPTREGVVGKYSRARFGRRETLVRLRVGNGGQGEEGEEGGLRR